jgi:hypothetical protein
VSGWVTSSRSSGINRQQPDSECNRDFAPVTLRERVDQDVSRVGRPLRMLALLFHVDSRALWMDAALPFCQHHWYRLGSTRFHHLFVC